MTTGYSKIFDFSLDPDLQAKGWSTNPDDYCWMACDRIGYRMNQGGYGIVLCAEHIRELESSARNGYSQAKAPLGSPPEPKAETDIGGLKWECWQEKYWWPWRGES